MSDIKKIQDLHSEEKLLKDYLEGNLSKEQQHAFEESMTDSLFLNDAVEGLQSLGNTQKMDTLVHQLNTQLQKQTQSNKQKRFKRRIKHLDAIETTVITVIALCLIGYFVVKQFHKKAQEKPATEIHK